MKKQLLVILVLIVILGAVYAVGSRMDPVVPLADVSPVVTTDTPAPIIKTESSLILGLNQTLTVSGVAITPLEVLEDSRCPSGVACIWAGTVRVRTKIQTISASAGSPSGEEIFILSLPQNIEVGTMELVDVTPAPVAGSPITPSSYHFTFKIIPG